MKAEQTIEQDKLHLIATEAASSGPLAKKARETAAAIEEFKTSPEPIDVAAAAFVERLAQHATPAPSSTSDDFRWDAETNPSVVCPEQRSLAIYTNAYGQAVIRQERSWDEEDDTWICISKSHLQDVIDRLKHILSSDG
ncbi:hypothetical protein [Tardiphaga sp. 803_E3_N1_3]|uniref:hypothetical protein n=1 Tax=Tardiphaga sp. 803_E3_N1_3 TaxID=3240785 RepID=UPI003F283C93